MKTIEEIREFFAKDRYACGLTGAFIEEVAEGYAKVSLKIEDKHLNGSGHVMGGVYYTLADLAAAVAVNQNFDEELCVGLNGQISHIASVTEGVLYAEASVLKNGRKILFVDVRITNEEGKLLTQSSMTSYKVMSK